MNVSVSGVTVEVSSQDTTAQAAKECAAELPPSAVSQGLRVVGTMCVGNSSDGSAADCAAGRCHGHGACGAKETPQCSCDAGYSGPTCATTSGSMKSGGSAATTTTTSSSKQLWPGQPW